MLSLLTQGLAGIQPINVPGIENVGVYFLSKFVTGDTSFRMLLFFTFHIEIHLALDLQVNVTELVEGHSSYLWATQQILEQLELDAYYPVFSSTLVQP